MTFNDSCDAEAPMNGHDRVSMLPNERSEVIRRAPIAIVPPPPLQMDRLGSEERAGNASDPAMLACLNDRLRGLGLNRCR